MYTNLILSVSPDEFIQGIFYWILLILSIIVLVKFFQLVNNVKRIKEILENIEESLCDEDEDKDK